VKQTIILYLSDMQSGGTEWFALRLARGLKEKGLSPRFLVAQKKGSLLPLIQGEFDVTTLSATKYQLFNLLGTLPAMIRFLRQQPSPVLISGLPYLNIVAAIAKVFCGKALHLIVVEHMRLGPPLSFSGFFKQASKLALTWLYQRLADAVVCVSKTVKDDMRQLGASSHSRAALIYNPLIPPNFEALAQRPVDHSWLLDKTQPTLLAVGRLLPVKDYPTLLRAFAQVLQTKPARLIILGEGEERASLEALISTLSIQSSVSLAGETDNVFPFLKAADLLVLASTSEAFGNVIVEALACGTPVVSTDCGGPREILQASLYGTLVAASNPSEMAKAILAALETSPDKEKLKERGLSFSVENAVNAYTRLFQAAASAASRRDTAIDAK
jgi:glycosyltransferase involved in cell wall biosynthesis